MSSELPCPFVSVTSIGNPPLCGEHNPLAPLPSPIPNAWYQSLAWDVGMLFRPTVPSAQELDTSGIAPADASSPDTGMEHIAEDAGRYFAIDEVGTPVLIVPRSLENQEAVKDFITKALNSGQLDKGVRRVKCSRCKNKKAEKLWEVKPSNLEHHIFCHFNIKCHPCPIPGCRIDFTTKDQMCKHVTKKHPGVQVTIQGSENRKATNGQAVRDIYDYNSRYKRPSWGTRGVDEWPASPA